MSNSNESTPEVSVKCNCWVCEGYHIEVTRLQTSHAVEIYKSNRREQFEPSNFYSTIIDLLLHG